MAKEPKETPLDLGADSVATPYQPMPGALVVAKHEAMKAEVHKIGDGILQVFAPEKGEYISQPKPEQEVRERLTPSEGWVWV